MLEGQREPLLAFPKAFLTSMNVNNLTEKLDRNISSHPQCFYEHFLSLWISCTYLSAHGT